MVGVHGSVPHQTSERGDVCVAFFIHLFKFFLLFKAYQITEQNHEKKLSICQSWGLTEYDGSGMQVRPNSP